MIAGEDCLGCVCLKCARNVDEVQYFTPGETDWACYNCDDHSGGIRHRGHKSDCPDYVEPVRYREMKARIEKEKANAERRKLRIVKEFK